VLVTLGRTFGVPANPAGLALWLVAGVSVTITLAWLSWRLVERPAMRIGRRGQTSSTTLPVAPRPSISSSASPARSSG
jgi:peptidoglycan/LPS O-acetylase OafA/YrhL